MSGVNQINLVGNAGKEPDFTVTSTGKPVCKFSLAVSEYSGKDQGGNATYTTQWFNVIAWNGLAEMAEKLIAKGNTYFVSGRLVVRQYDGKNGKSVSVDVVANTLVPVGKKANGDTPSDKHPAVTAPVNASKTPNLDAILLEDEEDQFSGL